jgi:hypothetical protein
MALVTVTFGREGRLSLMYAPVRGFVAACPFLPAA